MISVRQVFKSFGRVEAVRGISFDVPPGQVVGLLGANGAGKTTTLRMIVGFLPPDRGQITVAGHDTLGDSLAARAAIGYLPESAPAYPEMAVEDFLDFRARLYRLRRKARLLAIEQAVERCDLREVQRRRIGQLSKGFRQRVGLAAAILHAPDVLVLDEPTNGLDPRQIGHARRLIRQIAQGCTVLVSSHILPEVEQTCDRVIVMSRGSIRADATPRELVDTAAHDAPYLVEVRPAGGADVDGLLAVVRGVSGVAGAERESGDGTPAPPWVRVRISVRSGAPDLREPVAAALAGRGALVRELRRVTPSLERVVLRLIESDPDARSSDR